MHHLKIVDSTQVAQHIFFFLGFNNNSTTNAAMYGCSLHFDLIVCKGDKLHRPSNMCSFSFHSSLFSDSLNVSQVGIDCRPWIALIASPTRKIGRFSLIFSPSLQSFRQIENFLLKFLPGDLLKKDWPGLEDLSHPLCTKSNLFNVFINCAQ